MSSISPRDHRRSHWIAVAILTAASTIPPVPAVAQGTAEPVPSTRDRHALIVVGLPGDPTHESAFRELTETWVEYLTARARIDRENIRILFGRDGLGDQLPATQANVRAEVAKLTRIAAEDDSVWLFLLGHGSQDERHSWFHLPGPDMNEADWAAVLADLKCREQILWITQAASGAFLNAMSRPSRVVIAATAATGEVNETQLPYALGTVMRQSPATFDTNNDGKVSLAELFQAADTEVERHFEDHSLAPTEHAQLDDNGDGRGSEAGELATTGTVGAPGGVSPTVPAASAVMDGFFATGIIVEIVSAEPTK